MLSRLAHWLPAPIVIHAAVIVVILAAVSVVKGLGDPDYYWHVTAGRLVVETGAVPAVDPFSFTWQGQPWTPHEWLSEVAMHLIASGVGPGGTLLIFGVVAGAAIAVVSVALSRCGLRTAAVALPATLAALVFLPYVTARPQAISWLLLGVELMILMQLRSDRPARALLLVPLFAVWANLHGLYVVGLGVAGAYLLFTLAGRTPMSGARRWMLAATIGAGLASMLTPAGPAGLLYPLRYVDASDWGLANIQEWQSPNFHEPAHLAFLGLILATVISGGRATPGWMAFLAYVGIMMGLLALRNAPIAAILAMPTLSHALDAYLASRPDRRRSPSLAVGRRLIEITVAVAVAAAAWVILMPADADQASLEAARSKFPVEAVAHVRSVDGDARVVAEYGWAGYVIHELHRTGGRVFVDGRNDMYPESLLEEYSAVRAADPGWEAILDRHGAEWLLFPPDAAITRGSAVAGGWCEAIRDETQVLLERCP